MSASWIGGRQAHSSPAERGGGQIQLTARVCSGCPDDQGRRATTNKGADLFSAQARKGAWSAGGVADATGCWRRRRRQGSRCSDGQSSVYKRDSTDRHAQPRLTLVIGPCFVVRRILCMKAFRHVTLPLCLYECRRRLPDDQRARRGGAMARPTVGCRVVSGRYAAGGGGGAGCLGVSTTTTPACAHAGDSSSDWTHFHHESRCMGLLTPGERPTHFRLPLSSDASYTSGRCGAADDGESHRIEA